MGDAVSTQIQQIVSLAQQFAPYAIPLMLGQAVLTAGGITAAPVLVAPVLAMFAAPVLVLSLSTGAVGAVVLGSLLLPLIPH